MTRILFLCSGNTCRSPMAAGFAEKIFGASHQIASAGAEVDEGAPVATNAVMAMKSFDIDISSHSAADICSLDLSLFNLVVVFRPSAAEAVAFPKRCRLVHIELEDPYGGTPAEYLAAARTILRNVRRIYAEDALERLSSRAGSHGSGIFGRAVRELEKEAFRLAAEDLGMAMRPKATLGETATILSSHAVHTSDQALAAFAVAAADANQKWKDVKHKDDPPQQDLMAALASVVKAFESLDRMA